LPQTPIIHNPNDEKELMPVFLVGDNLGIPPLILDYLDGDLDSYQDQEGIKRFSADEWRQLTFFGNNLVNLMAPRLAKLILAGDKKSV
jgi:hypothetical protein